MRFSKSVIMNTISNAEHNRAIHAKHGGFLESHDSFAWHQVVVLLVAAGVLVPFLHRLRMPSVLGYLIVGSLLGPYGLALWVPEHAWLAQIVIADPTSVKEVAELGVIFLLFMIGLDLSLNRLWAMRRWVFGLGTLQVLLTAACIALVAWWFGNSRAASAVLGLCLALSSTAVVMQLLIDRQQLGTPLGQSSFSILLLQDLAVVPVLFLVGVLSRPNRIGLGTDLLLSLGQAALVIAAIYLLGQRVIRPLYHMVARERSVEMFTALTLLIILGTATITAAFGLSMALGAFLAGLLLAETEFRHEIEINIEPFKGLLLGLFFMSVGMGIDYRMVNDDLGWIILSVAGLFALKSGIIFLLGRCFALPRHTAFEAGMLLGQGGEFAFVVVGLAMGNGLVSTATGQFILIVAGLSMMVTPLVAILARRVAARLEAQAASADAQSLSSAPMPMEGHIIIAGFGRVGKTLVRLLTAECIAYVALDRHAATVKKNFNEGAPIFYGDASHMDMLKKLHIDHARALVITMDNPIAAERVVSAVRTRWPALPVFVRARDTGHAARLLHLGATEVVPETIEASLHLASRVLQSIGVPDEVARHHVETERAWILERMRSDS
jgi:CPA2 family monovalent cation:H+ antiporter-2